MSYAMHPPRTPSAPCLNPSVNHAQQPHAGAQAPTPTQQQQHGQGQAGPQGGEGGQTPRPRPSQSPFTIQGPPPPTYQHPHPQTQPSQTPQLRAEVVRILANTTNQCITEVDRMPAEDRRRLQHLEMENRELTDNNTKLFEDNMKLVEALKVENRKLELMNLNQTQQVWVKTFTDLQSDLAKVRDENRALKNDRHALVSRVTEMSATVQNIRAQTAANASKSEALTVAHSHLAIKLSQAEQMLKIYHTHGQTCPSFQQQYAQYTRRASGPPSVMAQQPSARGSTGSLSTMPSQQYALMQQQQAMQQQQRRASAPMLPVGQRPLSQPGTPVVASPAMHSIPAPPGSYSGGRPVPQQQNGASSSSRPSSTQPGQPGTYPTHPQNTSMGPPQQVLGQQHQNRLHVRTPSQQQFVYVNGAAGNGIPVGGHPGPRGSGSRSNSSMGQLVPIQNMSTQAQAQAQSQSQQQAALNARLHQHQQRFQQQYPLQQQHQLQQSQSAAHSPAGQAQVTGSLQQPVPTKPLTPIHNSRPAGSPSPQIFSNALMHSTGNHLGQPNMQSRSRAQSVISVSDSSRPGSSASTGINHAQAHASPSSQIQNTAQAGMGSAVNQQQAHALHRVPQHPPQTLFQPQSVQAEMLQRYQQLHQEQEQERLQQQQIRQQQAQQQQAQQQQFQQPQAQQPPPQSYSHPSTPIPVPPSPGTQPPPPSGSTDAPFLGDQLRDSSQAADLNGATTGMNQSSGGVTAVPLSNGNMGTLISTALAVKRGSVVLEEGFGDEESRKKMRMSEEGGDGREGSEMEVDAKPNPSTKGGDSTSSRQSTVAPSVSQSESGGGEDGDEEDEEEEEEDNVVGPDGLRTVESCLESFFAKEGNTRTCRMCLKRHATGLIPAPVSFTNAEDQALVDHCLAEHDVVWNRARQDV